MKCWLPEAPSQSTLAAVAAQLAAADVAVPIGEEIACCIFWPTSPPIMSVTDGWRNAT